MAHSGPNHLVAIVHGLWGNPSHMEHVRKSLEASDTQGELDILVVKSNADSYAYDGVDVGGERIANEIEQRLHTLKSQGETIRKISVTGYSLGGLVSRYAVGLLYQTGLFDRIEPVNFTTFATPHIGIRTPKRGYRAYLWNELGARTLSASGQQMFLVDNFRDTGRPLLSVLADESSIFMKALRLFKNKTLYANTLNDRSVPYYTACFSRADPFVDLSRIDVHYAPHPPGQQVLLDPDHPVSRRRPADSPPGLLERVRQASQAAAKSLPFYMLLCGLVPIVIPAFLANAAFQSYKSGARMRLHEAGRAGIERGRYRIPLLEEAQALQERAYERIVDGQREEYLPTPPPEEEEEEEEAAVAKDEAQVLAQEKTASAFPTLALTPEQFQMIDSLDRLGFTKYRAHIQKVHHTHAAIIVRMQRGSFDEGRIVVRHWVEGFEI